jgi:hypothetical protein
VVFDNKGRIKILGNTGGSGDTWKKMGNKIQELIDFNQGRHSMFGDESYEIIFLRDRTSRQIDLLDPKLYDTSYNNRNNYDSIHDILANTQVIDKRTIKTKINQIDVKIKFIPQSEL